MTSPRKIFFFYLLSNFLILQPVRFSIIGHQYSERFRIRIGLLRNNTQLNTTTTLIIIIIIVIVIVIVIIIIIIINNFNNNNNNK